MKTTPFLERLRGPVPSLKKRDLQNGRWLRAYARHLFVSMDAFLFLCSGVTVGVLAELFTRVEKDGEALLVALAAVGFAALAVALTALAIFVSLVNDAYLRVLGMSERGGLTGYLVPFLSAALISSFTTIFGAVGAMGYAAVSPAWAKAVILGLEVGLVVWSTWAVFQIVVEIAVHGLNRYETARTVEKAKMPDLTEIFQDESKDE